MRKWVPCKRRDFINKLKVLGFDGPFSGTKHQFMILQNFRLTIPLNEEYSIPELKMLIKEIEEIIDKNLLADEWNKL
jgi:hypothetical protein